MAWRTRLIRCFAAVSAVLACTIGAAHAQAGGGRYGGYARAPYGGRGGGYGQGPYGGHYGYGAYGGPGYGRNPGRPPGYPGGEPFGYGAGQTWRQQQAEVRQAVREGRRRPLGQVIETVRQRAPGRLLDAGVEPGPNGREVYRLRWAARDGRRMDFLVDAETGGILAVEGGR